LTSNRHVAARAGAELGQHVHHHPVAVAGERSAQRLAIAFLQHRACRAGNQLAAAEIDRALAVGAARQQRKKRGRVTGFRRLLDAGQQRRDAVVLLCARDAIRADEQRKHGDDQSEWHSHVSLPGPLF
jgi:hypothetical protein